MEIRRYLSIIRRHLVLVVFIIVAALAAGWMITPRTETYTATSTLYVGSRSINLDPTSDQISGDRVAGLDRLIGTFVELVESRPVAERAARRAQASVAGVPLPADIVSGTMAEQVPNTNLIEVSFTSEDPVIAQRVSDSVARTFVEQIREFEPRETETEAEQVISIYQPAARPTLPEPSGLRRNLILTGVLGVLVAGAVLALLEYLDITVRSPEDAERQLGLPVLGVIPPLRKEESLGRWRPIARTGPAPVGAERPGSTSG
jgi:capsular polysaccharide biosynthesis protein